MCFLPLQGLHVQPGILRQPLLPAQRRHLLLLRAVPQQLPGLQVVGTEPRGAACSPPTSPPVQEAVWAAALGLYPAKVGLSEAPIGSWGVEDRIIYDWPSSIKSQGVGGSRQVWGLSAPSISGSASLG